MSGLPGLDSMPISFHGKTLQIHFLDLPSPFCPITSVFFVFCFAAAFPVPPTFEAKKDCHADVHKSNCGTTSSTEPEGQLEAIVNVFWLWPLRSSSQVHPHPKKQGHRSIKGFISSWEIPSNIPGLSRMLMYMAPIENGCSRESNLLKPTY